MMQKYRELWSFGAGHGSFMWWSKMWCREREGNIICAVQQTRLCAITGVLFHSAGLKRAGYDYKVLDGIKL